MQAGDARWALAPGAAHRPGADALAREDPLGHGNLLGLAMAWLAEDAYWPPP